MSLGFRVVARSHVGLVRSGNEDAGLAASRVLAVADGMGGHAAGEVASAAVIQSIEQSLEDLPESLSDVRDWAVRHINEAHAFVGDLVAEVPDRRGMGTTLTMLVTCDEGLVLAHIGDSRAYRLRAGQLTQLSNDHTYVQMLVESGELTSEQAVHHPRRNLLMRTIDGIHEVELDLKALDLQVGDRYLVCSDGLSGVMNDAHIAELLQTPDATLAVTQLIDFALAAGAPDNVTVVVGDVVEGVMATQPFTVGCAAISELPVAENPRRKRRWLGWLFALLPALLLAGFVGWLNTQWYVGAEAGYVAIYHGIPQSIGPVALSNEVERSTLQLNDLDNLSHAAVQAGIPVASLDAARTLLSTLVSTSGCSGSCG